MSLILPEDAAIGDLFKTTVGSYLRRTDRTRSWSSVEFDVISHGQPRAYADAVDDLLVTFTGGTPSAKRGWELAHATHPPFARKDHVNGPTLTILDMYSSLPDPVAARERAHYDRIKSLIRPFRGWDTDSTVGEKRVMGGRWLQKFSVYNVSPFYTTYSVVIHTMNMD